MDFSFAPGEDLDDLGTTVTKYENNLQSLRILKELEMEGRSEATLHEQTVLARYTGWGDSTLLKRAFPGGNAAHIPPAEDLQELVTPDELKALRSSALNAHYTSLPVIRAIYAGLMHIGLHLLHQEKGERRLRVLEPAVGVGHFLGAMPHELKERSEWASVELDPLSARITKLLYPNARLFAEGFETANLPSNWFDLVISNVPFGNYKVCDPSVKEHYLRASIHDYFFTKALRVTRPSGIVAFITSRFTLDKQDTRVRLYLATHAELLACVRLPNDAFARNAGTQVVTDILFLRKRAAPDREAAAQQSWVQAEETTVMHEQGTPMNITLNRSFIADPTLMLGQPIVGPHGMYGRNEFTVKGDERNLGESLTQTLHRILPRDLLAAPTTSTGIAGENVERTPTSLQEPDLLEFIQQQEFGGMSEARASIEQARARHLLDIYTAAKEVIQVQVDGKGDEQLQAVQAELNRLYDRFRIRYGYINSKQNLAAFHRHNSLLAFLRALEEPTRFGGSFRKAPLFTERTIRPLRGQTEPQGAAEALLLALNEHGSADLAVIAASCRKTIEQVREELRGLIFQTPSGEWLTRDDYLSGNVFVRLREAEAAAELDPTFQENVEALRAAQPTLLGAGEITARLGAAWIPEAVIETFARALVPRYTGKIRYLAPTAQWIVEPPSWDVAATIEATQQWGTNRVHALDILDDALNLRRTIVFDQVDEKTRVVNRTETISAQAKLDDMKEKFLEWVWQDAMRERELCRLYNEQFNCVRERRYDGSHLTLPGASTRIELRPAQKDAVWRILQSKTTLVAHTVGAGKTLTAIAAAIELRRLKFAQKSMIVVPKHVVPQWAAEADKLYPGLKMLTTDARDFTRERRGETMSRIATGDWDLIIIPHPSFKLLPVKDETANRFINDEMERLRGYISELKDDDERGNRRSIKSMEKTLKRFEAKLKCAESEIRHDDKDTITFEEMGVEALFVDEFQSYKNLYFPTKMSRVPGLANSESQQAFDMFIKSQWLLGQGGRFIGLTGTPISNTLCEGYVMMRYFQLDLLRELGLDHFDSWAQSFGETVTGVEMRPDGSGFRVNTRFAKFVNLAELARLQRMCWDVRTPEQLNLPRPDLAGGSPITVAVPASPELIEFVGELSRRSELVSARRVSPSEDNMLKITSEGRKAALDMRLVRPEFGELPINKIDALVERIGRLWQRTHANRGAQIVFCDLSTPKSRGGVNASRPDIENGVHTEEQELDLAA